MVPPDSASFLNVILPSLANNKLLAVTCRAPLPAVNVIDAPVCDELALVEILPTLSPDVPVVTEKALDDVPLTVPVMPPWDTLTAPLLLVSTRPVVPVT